MHNILLNLTRAVCSRTRKLSTVHLRLRADPVIEDQHKQAQCVSAPNSALGDGTKKKFRATPMRKWKLDLLQGADAGLISKKENGK